MKEKPNILFFFTDDQRFDTIRALGNSEIYTPNLDTLVDRGTSFTRAHIQGGTCGAVCMPSRAMLHSGRTLFRIEHEGQMIPRDHTTLGECFRAAGYDVFGTGKWHNGRESFARSFSDGNEIFFGGMDDHWNVPVYKFDPAGQYARKQPYVADPFHSNKLSFRGCDHIEPGRHSTDLFTEASIRFIEDRNNSEPFFMYVSLMAPHDPRTMPEKFLEMYDPSSIELPPSFMPEHPIDTGALRIRDELLAAFPREPGEIKQHIAEYYAMISHLDAAFGRLVATLERKGILDNTIIVVAGDNGLAIGKHGLMGKQNLYEHSVRVPLIFAGPGIPQGARSKALVYLSDIFPTLCALAGIKTPASVETQSLLPCIQGKTETSRDCLYLAYGDSIRGLTNGSHKLIEYACGATQLFDLADDPAELSNMADDKAFSGLLAKMREKLACMAEEWDDILHRTGKVFWEKRLDIKSEQRS